MVLVQCAGTMMSSGVDGTGMEDDAGVKDGACTDNYNSMGMDDAAATICCLLVNRQ